MYFPFVYYYQGINKNIKRTALFSSSPAEHANMVSVGPAENSKESTPPFGTHCSKSTQSVGGKHPHRKTSHSLYPSHMETLFLDMTCCKNILLFIDFSTDSVLNAFLFIS